MKNLHFPGIPEIDYDRDEFPRTPQDPEAIENILRELEELRRLTRRSMGGEIPTEFPEDTSTKIFENVHVPQTPEEIPSKEEEQRYQAAFKTRIKVVSDSPAAEMPGIGNEASWTFTSQTNYETAYTGSSHNTGIESGEDKNSPGAGTEGSGPSGTGSSGGGNGGG